MADDVLDEVEALLRGSSAARRGGRGGIVQTPDIDVLARLRGSGPAGVANVALCVQTGRTEAFMAIMLKHAREVGLVELSVPRDQRAAYRLTDLGDRWVEAMLSRDAEQLPEPGVIDADADEIRELPPG